jgi:DNA polymerase-4
VPGAADIIHADLDAFYAAVEVRDRPGLRGLPVAVGGGVVLSATYEARRFGVSAPLPIGQARRRCPGLILVPPRFRAYVEASRNVMTILDTFTPAVEPISIDEAFLDVAGCTHLFGSAAAIGGLIRLRVREEVGLPISVGVATTKHLAKIASRVAKPDGMTVVPAGTEADFLAPLPVGLVWGIGTVGEQRLARYGVATIGDLRALPEATVAAWFGHHWGPHLWALANNRDPRPVHLRARTGSVGAQSAGDATDPVRRHHTLLGLAERIGPRLRRKGLAGRRITVRIRLDDRSLLSRARTSSGPLAETTPIFRIAAELTDSLIAKRASARRITLLGIAVSSLEPSSPLQLCLPALDGGEGTLPGTPSHVRFRAIDEAVDRTRERFGPRAVVRASLLEWEAEERGPADHLAQ